MRRRRRSNTVPLRPSASSGGQEWRLSNSTWKRVWVGLAWLTTLAAAGWGVETLDKGVRARQSQIGCHIELVDLPDWLASNAAQDIRAEIESAAGLAPSDNVADEALCSKVAARLKASPWIAQLIRVTKRPDGCLRIQAVYREPFAFVERDGVVYRVDSEGVRLPLPRTYHAEFIEDRFWNDWFRISGVAGAPPDEGQAWPGEDVRAGLALVRYLKEATARGEVPFRSSLRAIDVSNWKLRRDPFGGRLRIRTVHPRGVILWVLPHGDEYPIEPAAQRKLEMLRTLYIERGRLPDDAIDVRGSVVKIGDPRTG